jgi:GAF domain-containing protein
MHETTDLDYGSADFWEELERQARGLVAGETDDIANAANLAALLFHAMPRVNWAGFYLLKDGELVVGPFQGRPACVRIALGRGVCGTAALESRTVVVPDVDAFPGHIPCDAASRSEVVVPLRRADGRVVGVLDVDSPERDRFPPSDVAGLDALARVWDNVGRDH